MSWIDDAMQQMQQWLRPAQRAPAWDQGAETDAQAELLRRQHMATDEESPTLPFHPSDRSLRRAPESSLTQEHVTSIARARRLAEKHGILTPELGDHLLPMAMVEGWGPTMGVRNDNAFYASPRLKKMAEQMGLKNDKDYITTYVKGEPHIIPQPNSENGPYWAATLLGEKSRLKGVLGTDDAIRRYNGKGKALEDTGGQLVPADVEVYLGKVRKARELLAHPKNAAISKHFNTEYSSWD